MQITGSPNTTQALLAMERDIAKNKLEIVEAKIELQQKNDQSYKDILENRIKILKNRNTDIARLLREGRSVYA